MKIKSSLPPILSAGFLTGFTAPCARGQDVPRKITRIPGPPMKVKGYITIQWVVMRAKWISGDLPAYPEEARQKLIHGPVKLGLRIGEDGKVRHVSVLSGNRALANPAAEEAVRWQFQTTLLSGKPIGVLTEVDLKYSLHHGKAEVRCTDGSAQRKH